MTNEERKLWKSIRQAMADAVNDKCPEGLTVCFTCQQPMEDAEGAPRQDEHMECFKARTSNRV